MTISALGSNGEAAHVIMDRLTGKTNDAIVEFDSQSNVVNAVSNYTIIRQLGHCGRFFFLCHFQLLDLLICAV